MDNSFEIDYSLAYILVVSLATLGIVGYEVNNANPRTKQLENNHLPHKPMLEKRLTNVLIIDDYLNDSYSEKEQQLFEPRANSNSNQTISIISQIKSGSTNFIDSEFKIIFLFVITIVFLMICWNIFFSLQISIIAASLCLLYGVITCLIVSKLLIRFSINAVKEEVEVITDGSFSSYSIQIPYLSSKFAAIVYVTVLFCYSSAFYLLSTFGIEDKIEVLCFYGFGSSFAAFFARVAGGIFTKGADISCDIIGKNLFKMVENDKLNPISLADNIGDLIGDLVGSVLDLVSSITEAFSAFTMILYISLSSTSTNSIADLITKEILSLVLSSVLILVIVEWIVQKAYLNKEILVINIEESLLLRLKLHTLGSLILSYCYFSFIYPQDLNDSILISNWFAFLNVVNGLISSFLITYSTFYYTSQYYSTVQQITSLAGLSPGINIIMGLAAGYSSTIVPIMIIALTIFLTYFTSGLIGLGFVGIGVILLIPIIVQLQIFGPISDVSLGILNLTEANKSIIDAINIFDTAGNTVSAMVKGYSTGSTGLISFALFSALMLKTGILLINLSHISSLVFLLLGSLYCYIINGLAIRATGRNAILLIKDCQNHIEVMNSSNHKLKPDYFEFIQLSAEYSYKHAVIISFISTLFIICIFPFTEGLDILPLLTGLIINGMPLAISSSNSGSAWDNSKKIIENSFDKFYDKTHKESIELQRKNSLNNALVGDNVGDALKDIAGPCVTILIKFSSFLCLILFNTIS